VESKSSWTWTPPWCGRPSTSSLSPWPFPSPCWSFPLFLINNTCIEPSVSSEKQLTRLERTWRSNCRARPLVIGPCIVCKGEMSSSGEMNLASSFSHILGWTMRIHMLTCKDITVGLKGLMTRSFVWGDQIVGRTNTSFKCHAKMSRLAQRR
jgi:hypothetical protein